MPQDLASGLANYMPPRHGKYPNEIWIIAGLGRQKYFFTLLHELGHWAIEFLPCAHKIHNLYDWRPQWVKARWKDWG